MPKKPTLTLKIVFSLLLLNFILLLNMMFVPVVRDFFQGKLFLLIMIIFFLLGITFTFLVFGERLKAKLKKFLFLTGFSAVGFFIFAVLHNVFYALAELSKEIIILPNILEFIHAAFFIISVIICPIGFVVGVVGSLILLFKRK